MIVSQTENQKAAATLSPTQAHDPHVGCSLRAPGPLATGRYEASLSALSAMLASAQVMHARRAPLLASFATLWTPFHLPSRAATQSIALSRTSNA